MKQIRPKPLAQGRQSRLEESHVPDTITVVSGTYATKDIINKVKNKTVYNLSKPNRGIRTPRTLITNENARKYTIQERIWQSTADLEDLQKKYNVEKMPAQHIRYQAQAILKRLIDAGIDPQTCE